MIEAQQQFLEREQQEKELKEALATKKKELEAKRKAHAAAEGTDKETLKTQLVELEKDFKAAQAAADAASKATEQAAKAVNTWKGYFETFRRPPGPPDLPWTQVLTQVLTASVVLLSMFGFSYLAQGKVQDVEYGAA